MNQTLRFARRPVVSIHGRATIEDACDTMVAAGVGAVVVLADGMLVGVISERDIVGRVVAPRRDPARVRVDEVMTREVRTADVGVSSDEAMEIMDRGGFRHLPLLNAAGRVVAVLSMRDVLRARVDELDQASRSLAAYIAADGPGG